MIRADNRRQLVSIIIVNYNGKKWLKNCFDSIAKQTYRNFETVLVDNGSTDASVDYIKKYYPDVRLVINQINIGFGAANNLAVKSAQGEIIFFLNNDTILEKSTLEILLQCKKDHNYHILGPKIVNYEGKEIYRNHNLSIDVTGYIGDSTKTFYVDGCALMIGKDDFVSLEGFDEKYFMYSEEIDLCWRAHLYGMKVGVCHEAKIKHIGGGTGGSTLFHHRGKHEVPLQRRYEVEKNNLRNVLKNYRFINLLWILPLFEFQSFCELLLYLLTGRFAAGLAICKAHVWNLIHFTDTWYQRRIIQSKRKIGDRKVLSMVRIGSNKLSALMTIGIPKMRD